MKTVTKDLSEIREKISERRVLKVEELQLNEKQEFLFNRALRGLKVYTQEELENMHEEKKERITRVYWKAQRVLNVYKQEIINDRSNEIFVKLFPKSQLTKLFVNELNVTHSKLRSNMSFYQLGCDKSDIVNKLIEKRVLPPNFYKLEE